ncbi:MAG: DNA methyltransferase, partial [Halobacteriales archaeon]
PRVWWEPWLVYRKPLEGRLRDNLAEWETGGLRRESAERPFTDLLEDGKTPKEERKIVADAHPEGGDAHPSLKPQYLMRELCHAALPLQKGEILDPFMGAGSTVAAADALGYDCAGIEIDETFYEMAEEAVPKLSEVETEVENRDDFGSSARGRSQSLSDFS